MYTVTTGISTVAGEQQPTQDAVYDLTGRKAGNSTRGLLIKTVRHADGTVENVKTLRR